MNAQLKILLSSILIVQALIIGIFSWNVANGLLELKIGNFYIFLSNYDTVIQCDYPERPEFIPPELWDPAPPKCHVANWVLIPSLVLGAAGTGALIGTYRNKRNNKK